MQHPVLIIIIVFCVFFKFWVGRKPKNDPDADYLELERKANLTPRKDISDLPYIKVPVETLPLSVETDREEVIERQEIIKSMADKMILNLTGRTNTDLKLEYGAPNINILSAADNNYTKLVQALSYLSSDYIEAGHIEEAKTLLEYGISIGTDSRKNYLALAGIYKKEGRPDKINDLITHVDGIDSLLKDSIKQSLAQMIE